MARYPINTPYASGTTNKLIPTSEEDIQQGIPLEADIRSNLPNGLSFLEQSAIKELQNTGGLFNPNKIYQIGDFVSVLVSENGIYRILYYKCKTANLTNTPPVVGQDTGTPDVPIYSDITGENLNDWDRILFATKTKSFFNVANQCNVILIGASNANSVFGKLKIKTSGEGTTAYDVAFDIEFFGSASEFKISNVYYSPRVRASQNLANNLQIAHIGFCLDVSATGELHLYCFNTTFCTKIEFDYSDLNCPINPSITALNINKPYAIIEGGGVIRQGLGSIKNDYRNPQDAQSGETYDFYLFKNGYVVWNSAITLNSTYYHQWANGGFATLNIDVSDRVFRNVGTNATQTLGTLLGDAIRNITGRVYLNRLHYGAYGNNQPITQGYKGEGAFTGSETSVYSNINFGFDASNVVPTASENRGKSLTIIAVVQAF